MSKQLQLIDTPSTLETLPSAKVKAIDKVGLHSWTKFYASFSENFVKAAMKALDVKTNEIIVDPFVGAGTTLIASQKSNIQAIGVDIDPFACLLTRAKLANNFNIDSILSLLKKTTNKKISEKFSQEANTIFDKDCLTYASQVFARVIDSVDDKSSLVLQNILNDKQGKYDNEAIALTALCIGSAESAKLVRGSNPTWYRKAEDGEKDSIEALYTSTMHTLNKMINDLQAKKRASNIYQVFLFIF